MKTEMKEERSELETIDKCDFPLPHNQVMNTPFMRTTHMVLRSQQFSTIKELLLTNEPVNNPHS
jgi:hypothetical protein